MIAGAPWTLSDYILIGMLFGLAGLVLELALRASGSLAYRAAVVLAVTATVLLLWVNGAVGFLGDEGNPANLMFFGVIAVAITGTVIAGFRPAAMARAMVATGAAQVLVGAVGFAAGWASPGNAGIYEVVMGTTVFSGMWLISAALFRKAATG